MVLDFSGNVYGGTVYGGEYDLGTVFKVSGSGGETVLHSFSGSGGDSEHPRAGLVRDAKGTLLGTTWNGGTNQDGSIFRVSRSGTAKTLYSFVLGPDGDHPLADLVLDRNGNAYGTTFQGGNENARCWLTGYCGVVFELSKSGKYTVLYRFSGSDGANPLAGVILDDYGNLYGTTSNGGTGDCHGLGCGTVFKLDRKGKLTVLHNFAGGSDGECPAGDLVRDAVGNLYGTTEGNNLADTACNVGFPWNQYGTLFKVDKFGKETVLHNFVNNRVDGVYPQAGLARDAKGNLYGTTTTGGSKEGGTIYKVDSRGTETVLYNFLGTTDGYSPMSRLARDKKGNLYGTAVGGGDPSCYCGTVFKLSP
jgi:uncharacterized repeat protein (TIGR03803 family)